MGDENIYEKFDKRVQQIVIWAKAASIDAKVDCIYPESFMIGILTMGTNAVTAILVEMDVDLEKCLKQFKQELAKKNSSNEVKSSLHFGDIKISKQIIETCKVANKVSLEMKSDMIEIHHVFLALLHTSEFIKGVYKEAGLDIDDFIERCKKVQKLPVGDKDSTHKSAAKKGSPLHTFCVDVTEQARQNKLDPIIAREQEINNAITILCRRGKNNPILLGEPGVGKTAIVEGIAQRIVSGTVPKQLVGSILYSLNMSSLVAGTKYRGEFEERIHELVKDVQKTPNCILFIDEIHTLVGAGSAEGVALDASNILKPFLARSDLRCIGATTLDDFKKFFKKDGALTRRFQQIMVEIPTKEQTYQILSGIKHKFEEHHSCTISDEAIEAAINLSGRYMSDKNFPDKAIDCMDLACAKLAWNNGDSKTTILAKHIADVVSEQCQIPIEIIMWDDNERIKKIESTLSNRVMGQDYAVEIVCKMLKNAYSGIRDPLKPIGSFVFGGQSGTGKTYMAKELASAVFGKESSLIRLDMTEYSESHSVSKLVGSPPGYVGFRDTDVLVDKIKRKPHCIVLLDELEKAHPDIIKLFLQVMSDGSMTDAMGNKADFKNVILIMTGNFGMNDKEKGSLGFNTDSKAGTFEAEQKRLVSYCQDRYGLEFVNRVDEFVPFAPLSPENLKKIASIHLEELKARLVSRKCKFVFSDNALELLIRMSKDGHGSNAGILNRIISKKVEPCISDTLLSMDNKNAYLITVDAEDDKFACKKKKINEKQI